MLRTLRFGWPNRLKPAVAGRCACLALALMLVATGLTRWLEGRRFGIYLTAIREDESASEALGVDAAHYNRVLFRAKERFRELLTTAASQRGLKLVDS